MHVVLSCVLDCLGVADGFLEGQFVVDHVAVDVEFGVWLVQLADLAWLVASEDYLDCFWRFSGRSWVAGTFWFVADGVLVLSRWCGVGI